MLMVKEEILAERTSITMLKSQTMAQLQGEFRQFEANYCTSGTINKIGSVKIPKT